MINYNQSTIADIYKMITLITCIYCKGVHFTTQPKQHQPRCQEKKGLQVPKKFKKKKVQKASSQMDVAPWWY